MLSEILWAPGENALEVSNLALFARKNGFDPRNYDVLHAWSISDKGEFWSALWDFAELIGHKGDVHFVSDSDAPMTGARFFPDGQLNLAENLLRGDGAGCAVACANEQGDYKEVSRAALRQMVAKTANGLREAGIAPGDCVAGIMPNRLEALVAMLATLAVGGIWSSCSPDFGVSAIADRLGQIDPKVLFVSMHYQYGGKKFDLTARLAEFTAAMPSVEYLVIDGDRLIIPGVQSVTFADFGELHELQFHRVRFTHPSFVLYTSGTTGAPKAIVHSTGGVLLQHVKEHLLHGDVNPGDTVFWYTNIAWMMYHWTVSAMVCGARIVLYDGAPILKSDTGPDCAPLWRLAEQAAVTHFGISPRYLSTLAADGYVPAERHDLQHLRWLLSAGAPVAPAQYDWVFANVKSDMGFASISGGTEIIGCFLLGSPIHPVRRGELTVKGLGLAVNVMDGRNAPIVGERGDLVCTEPFPSMPLTFWGHGGYGRYLDTYFADREQIWTHGDVAELTITGGAVVHGRSDSTLKPGGVRIGSAEIYAACETIPAIVDCIVFGAQHDGDEEVVLCVKLVAGKTLDADLCQIIRKAIRDTASPFHVPKQIHQVADIPYTLNGKRVEGAIRAVVAGQAVKNKSSLTNPGCLTEFAQLDRSAAW